MWDAMKLRELARACRAMAERAGRDAERQGTSSSAPGFLDEQRRFTAYAAELEELAKTRG